MRRQMRVEPPGRGLLKPRLRSDHRNQAAVVPVCRVLGLAGHDGATVALGLGAGFAALGSVMSFLRLAVK